MAFTSKTVSEKLTQYYDHQFVQVFEQIDVEIVIVVEPVSIVDAIEKYIPDVHDVISQPNAADEQFEINIETADGKHVTCLARGTWLLTLIVTFCLALGILMFGEETVIAVLKTILSAYRG